MRHFLKQVLVILGSDARIKWLIFLASALAVSIVEALSAVCIGLVLALIGSPNQSIDVPLLGRLSSDGPSQTFIWLLIILAIFFLIRGSLVIAQGYIQGRVGHNTGVRLSQRLLDGYFRIPYASHLTRNSAEFTRNAYVTSTEVVSSVLIPLAQGISETLVILGLCTVLLVVAPLPTILAGILLAVTALTAQRAVRRSLTVYGEEVQETLGQTLESLNQSMTGLREVRILRIKDFFLEQFTAQRRRLARANYMRGMVSEIPRISVETVLVLTVLILILVASLRDESPREALTLIGLFGYAGFRVIPSMNRVVAAINSCRYGRAALDILTADLELIETSTQGEPLLVETDPIESIGTRDVTFTYPGSSSPALNEITVSVHRGESVGVAGGTGSGKSTLVQILAGLLSPEQGAVVVNGAPIASPEWAWTGQFGLVTQEVFLINDTIRRNVALGLEDADIDEERVMDILRTVQLEDSISKLPEGLATVVGDRGTRLSGGERQRLSIARSLYREPRILVLDEGTSALDVVTEQRLLRALMDSPEPATLIHVAHRLTSLRECDRILVFENGSLIDIGTFDELALRNEAFALAAASRK